MTLHVNADWCYTYTFILRIVMMPISPSVILLNVVTLSVVAPDMFTFFWGVGSLQNLIAYK